MKRFELHRDVDESGISGTGVVASGVVWPDGAVAMHWLAGHGTTTVFPDVATVEAVHGHNGATRIVWLDEDAAPAQPTEPEAGGPTETLERSLRIVRADASKRLGTYAVFEPGRVDSHGTYVDADEIERVAHMYMRKYRGQAASVGEQHEAERPGVVVVESWIARQSESFGALTVPAGTWLVTLWFGDDATWAAVQSGELGGISFGGTGEIGPGAPAAAP